MVMVPTVIQLGTFVRADNPIKTIRKFIIEYGLRNGWIEFDRSIFDSTIERSGRIGSLQ